LIPTIGLIGMVPISMNGMGWREISYIVLFSRLIDSVPPGLRPDEIKTYTETMAGTLAFLWLGILVITSLPGGIVYVARGGRKVAGGPPKADILEEDDLAEASVTNKRDGEHVTALPEKEPVSTI
jgi:hypothetical protein